MKRRVKRNEQENERERGRKKKRVKRAESVKRRREDGIAEGDADRERGD